MGNSFSWIRPRGLLNQAMTEPQLHPQRTLWCALPDDLGALIPIDCTVELDVAHVKEKIHAKSDLQVPAYRLNLYVPLTPISNDSFTCTGDHYQKLHPRDKISMDWPWSADPNVDLVCVPPRASKRQAADPDIDVPPRASKRLAADSHPRYRGKSTHRLRAFGRWLTSSRAESLDCLGSSMQSR